MANELTERVPPERSRSNGSSGSEPQARPPKPPTALTRAAEINAIQATRRPRKSRALAASAAVDDRKPRAPEELPAAPAPGGGTAHLPRGDSDPWTVPQSVRDRFVQDGHRFYFPDGAAAFKDLGRKLTTPSENTQVVHSLIEIAHSRGWTEVTVTGTDRFRQEAWRQARIAGLNVRGYQPSDLEQTQLIRALARTLARPGERTDALSSESAPAALRPVTPTPPESVEPVTSPVPSKERISGKLLDHGRDAYRHNPDEGPSYFARIQTRDGAREFWGKDIERALSKSLTQPQVGDEVILQRNGRDSVTVRRRERDGEGALRERAVEAYRNRWVLEKREFFEQRAVAAKTVHDETVSPREAVRRHPELAGTYLNLRAAELAARSLRDPQDQHRFVAQVRGALADAVERGDPLPPVRLRERVRPQTRSPQPVTRSGEARENVR